MIGIPWHRAAALATICVVAIAGCGHNRTVQSAEEIPADLVVGLEASASATVAVIEAELLAGPTDLPEYGPMATFSVLDVLWAVPHRTLQDGSIHPVTPLLSGTPADIFVRTGAGLEVGQRYVLFVNYVFGIPQPSPWRAWLTLTADGQKVVDDAHPTTVAEIDHVMTDTESRDTDAVVALISFIEEQVGALEVTNGGGTPTVGERTLALREHYSTIDPLLELEAWLALDPDERPLGITADDPPNGSEEALGVEWGSAQVMVIYDGTTVFSAGTDFEIASSVGVSGPFRLPPEDTAALFTVVFPRAESLSLNATASTGKHLSWLINQDDAARLRFDGGVIVRATGGQIEFGVHTPDEFREAVLRARP